MTRVGPPPTGLTEVELDGQVSVFDPQRNQLVALNQTATSVWRLCDGTRTVDEIVAVLAEENSVDGEAIQKDVAAALREFTVHGLLECVRQE